MPRDGSGVYTPPAGTDNYAPNTTIESSKANSFANDVETAFNTAWPVALGGSGATSDLNFSDINNATSIINDFLKDIGGTVTAGGTATVVTATLNRAFTAYGTSAGQIGNGTIIALKMPSAATGATTLNINGIGAKAIRRLGDSAISTDDWLANGTILLRYDTAYNAAAGAWVLLNREVAATSIPTAASTTEVITGTDTAKFATPDAIAALWEAGSDNTGGATITMGEGGYFNLITSTTAITAFAFTTDKAGRRATVRFDTARTLTHNGTSLIIPGAANVTTAQGDQAGIRSLGSGNFVVEWYTKADGTSVVGGGGWTLITSDQPTSDVASVSFTGLSGYSHIKVVFVFGTSTGTASPTLAVAARVSAGTYRDFGTIHTANATANFHTFVGEIEFNNFNDDTAIFKIMTSNVTSLTNTLDNTNAIAGPSTENTSANGAASWQEVWDDVRITASIEGSTSAQRGYFYVYGMT